jgi:ATP-dependent Clp protease ATP-binding subunit ClpC
MLTLEEYGTDLTKLPEVKFLNYYINSAQVGKLDLVVGRQPQIEHVVQILGRRTKNILA